MKISFYLLGKCDNSNPSSIPLKTLKQWGKEGIITYLGEAQDIRPIIAKNSCIVLPSIYKEGVPRTLLEAMSMQKPIITTDVSGCKECVKNPQKRQELAIGDNGILIPPKNPQSLANAIRHFLHLSQDQQRAMGEKGREYAKERFDIAKTIATYKQKSKLYAKKGKTLAFISNTSFGMSNFRIEVLKALQDEGYSIHIIAPNDQSTQTLTNQGFFFHSIQINSKGLNPLEDLSTLFSVYQILKEIHPSLVFNYTIKPAIYGSFACNLLSIPNIAVITGLGYVFIEGGIKKRSLKKFVCFLYHQALKQTQEVWFLNSDDCQTFLSHKIITDNQAMILDSEGINLSYFFPQEDKMQETSFILIARMLWDKGVGDFVEAIKILKKNHQI